MIANTLTHIFLSITPIIKNKETTGETALRFLTIALIIAIPFAICQIIYLLYQNYKINIENEKLKTSYKQKLEISKEKKDNYRNKDLTEKELEILELINKNPEKTENILNLLK